ANAQARVELRGFADEEAALRRVATLVARAAALDELFAAVVGEVGGLLEVDHAVLSRYDADGLMTVVGQWVDEDPGPSLAVGSRLEPDALDVQALVLETGRAARIDDPSEATDA